jgi:hypothetical protein
VNLISLAAICVALVGFEKPFTMSEYAGTPYSDSVFKGAPQAIPGKVMCAYYDLGGEGVAYHVVAHDNTPPKNQGSGGLNPADGTYLHEFRMKEAVSTSFTKYHDDIDDSAFDLVKPPENMMYVGWTDPGEWINMTVNIKTAGIYAVDFFYTSRMGGSIGLDLNGTPLAPPVTIIKTATDKDPIPWRQWHHWKLMKAMVEVKLPVGVHVLTLRVVDKGNLNLGYLDFRLKGDKTPTPPPVIAPMIRVD